MTRRIENLWDSVRGLLLTQYEESENLKAFIRVFVEALQGIEDSSDRLRNFADLDIADGRWLDLIGGIKNVNREPGESDDAFKGRLSIELGGTRAGTSAGVVDTAARLSGDPSPAYLDEAPGVFFVYTPNGKQIKRDNVQKLAPAGVIGLPGAAICTAKRKVLTDALGRIILAVGNDDWATRRITDEHENSFEIMI